MLWPLLFSTDYFNKIYLLFMQASRFDNESFFLSTFIHFQVKQRCIVVIILIECCAKLNLRNDWIRNDKSDKTLLKSSIFSFLYQTYRISTFTLINNYFIRFLLLSESTMNLICLAGMYLSFSFVVCAIFKQNNSYFKTSLHCYFLYRKINTLICFSP